VKGNYLLVDFWASWCGPCRKSIPKVKELYALYNNKGLEIVSVSIDTDDQAWRQAMADEQMPWKQVFSPNKDKTLKDFNIQGVPTLFLVDRQGRILEKFTGYSSQLEDLLKTKLK
jgi:thiol-disulfide isomerase/thioredoxin